MELPKYKLQFEVEIYLVVDKRKEIRLSENVTIILDKNKDAVLKGWIVIEVDTLDYGAARERAISKVTEFINTLLVAANLTSVKPTEFEDQVILINSDKFQENKKTITITIKSGFCIVKDIHDQWLEDTVNLINKKNSLKRNQKLQIDTCLSLLRKAAESKLVERFIFNWISLECLSGFLETNVTSTEAMINSSVNILKNEEAKNIFDKYESLLDKLIKLNLIGRGNQNRSQDLEDAISNIGKNSDYKNVIMKAAMCIYEIRNNVFHKGIETPHIQNSTGFLRDLIHAIIKSILL